MTHGSPDYSVSTVSAGGGTTIQPQKPYFNRDVVNRVLGDVAVFDPSTVQGAKACTQVSDPRVLGVVGNPTSLPGAVMDLYYTGECLVKVIGSGVAGQALVTSATAGAAQALGTRRDQPGFVGVALEAWSGPGLILADVMIHTDLFGGSVVPEGSTWGSVTSTLVPGNLQCGSNPMRAVLCMNIQEAQAAPALPVTVPTVNGANMTQIGTFTYTVTGGFGRITLYWLYNPPTGLQAVTRASTAAINNHNDVSIFLAMSGVLQSGGYGTPGYNSVNGVSTISAVCTDAIAGDLTIGAFWSTTNASPTFTSRGAGQTSFVQTSCAGSTWGLLFDASYKTAVIAAESQNWQISSNQGLAACILPVHPG